MGESWDEELRRNLYECLNLSYDYAFEKKNLNVQVPKEILDFIETVITSFITHDVNSGKYTKTISFSNLN